MIWSIVLAVDGSEHSYAAAKLLRDLPLSPNAIIYPLAVLVPRYTPGRAALLQALDKVRTILQVSDAEVETGLLNGHPAEALTNFADENRVDLMIVGAVGLRATLGILLGGTTQQVVEYAHCPVLIVRAPYAGLRRVLLVVDGSTPSRYAVGYVGEFPLPAGAEVQIMHVLPPLPQLHIPAREWPITTGDIPPLAAQIAEEEEWARYTKAEEQEGQALLDQTVATLQGLGIAATGMLARGDAATEILAHAKTIGADLIVAGSRGLTAVKGWWLGSVSRKLVHYAGCSVLIARHSSEVNGQ